MDFNYTTETITPDNTGSISFGGTTGIDLPVGTSSNRGSPVQGTLRFSTSIPGLEYFDGSSWDTILSGATGVTTLAGTANQITASASTGSVTLSLPAAVTITTSLTISGLTAKSFLYSGTAGLLTSTTAPTNGQLLIGNTGNAPSVAALTQGTGITITNGAGTITIANSGPTSIAGTTNQITASASTGLITLSIPSTFQAPGSLQVTTSLQVSATNTISAAGTSQGTATALTTDYNVVTTTGVGQGVVLPSNLIGRNIIVDNQGANNLLVYPPSSASLDGLSANIPVTIVPGQKYSTIAITSTQLYSAINSMGQNAGLVPNSPTNVQTYAGPTQVTVTWTPPKVGQPTSYTVTLNNSGGSTTVSTTTATLTGLTNGTAYTPSVVATNAYGNSAATTGNAATPIASGTGTTQVPSALTSVTSGLLFAWYAADHIAGSPTNGASIGGASFPWTDNSGNGYNPGTQPVTGTYVSSWENSKPSVLFNGSSTYLGLPFGLTALGAYFSFFIVVDLTAAVNGNGANDMRLVSNENITDINTWAIDSYGNGSSTNTFRIHRPIGTNQSSTISTSTPYVFSASFGLAADNGGFPYINGTKQTINLTACGDNTQKTNFVIGAVPVDTSTTFDKLWKGHIAEIIFFTGALTDTDRHAVESYLGTKYNITMAVQ